MFVFQPNEREQVQFWMLNVQFLIHCCPISYLSTFIIVVTLSAIHSFVTRKNNLTLCLNNWGSSEVHLCLPVYLSIAKPLTASDLEWSRFSTVQPGTIMASPFRAVYSFLIKRMHYLKRQSVLNILKIQAVFINIMSA